MTEQEARDPFEKIEAHNKMLCASIDRPDFDGDQALDPTINQAQRYIHAACEAVVLYPQGAFPLDFADAAVTTTRTLLSKCRRRYGASIVKPMEQAFNSWFNLWHYAGAPLHPPEIFVKKVFRSEQALIQSICDANVKIAAKKPARRGRCYGEKDKALHAIRAQVVAEIRRRKTALKLSWPKVVDQMRRDSAYAARMRGKASATWIRYAKSGFSG